jgi:hypothetical protein
VVEAVIEVVAEAEATEVAEAVVDTTKVAVVHTVETGVAIDYYFIHIPSILQLYLRSISHHEQN